MHDFFWIVLIILLSIFGVYYYKTRSKNIVTRRLWVLFELSRKFRSNSSLNDILFESLELIVDSLPDFSSGIILTWDEDYSIRLMKMYHELFGKIDSFDIGKELLQKIEEIDHDFRIDVKRENSFSDSRLIKSKYLHIFKLQESSGAFVFGSNKRQLDKSEYQFVRVLVDHSSYGLKSRNLLRKISRFAETIDVLEYTYQRIVDNLPLGVVGVDGRMRVALWNDLMKNMFGVKEADILEKPIQDMFHTKENKKLITDFISRTNKASGVQEVEELHYIDAKGNSKFFLVLGYQLKDDLHKMGGSILVFRDITESVKFEEKLKKARQIKEKELNSKIMSATEELQTANIELKKLNNLKSEFVSVVSHELRTPLTSIRGYASLLLSGRLGEISEKQSESLGIIKNEGERLSTLINDLLDLSKLEAGKTTLNLQKGDIKEQVKSVLDSLEVQFKEKNIETAITGKKKLKLTYDKDKMEQVLMNIIGNAIKFTPEKGKITIKLEDHKNCGIISVIDNGVGIAKKDLKNLFEPFHQVESHLKRSTTGSGLGLTISKHIVELHQGEIKVESQLKKGSTFSLIIPK